MQYIFNINYRRQDSKTALILYKGFSSTNKGQVNILVIPHRCIEPNRAGRFPRLSGVHQHYVDLNNLNRQPLPNETGFNLTHDSMEYFGEQSQRWIPKLTPEQTTTLFSAVHKLLDNRNTYTFVLVNYRGLNHRTSDILNTVPRSEISVYYL